MIYQKDYKHYIYIEKFLINQSTMLANLLVNVLNQESIISEKSFYIQNYPNPFNPSTTISFQIQEARFVTLKVYDVLGNEITTLVNDKKESGSYNITYDASELSSGTYIYQLRMGSLVETKKLMLVK